MTDNLNDDAEDQILNMLANLSVEEEVASNGSASQHRASVEHPNDSQLVLNGTAQVFSSNAVTGPFQENLTISNNVSPAVDERKRNYQQTLGRLLQILRSPRSVQQREEIINLLKSNRDLTAAVMIKRQQRQQQMQMSNMTPLSASSTVTNPVRGNISGNFVSQPNTEAISKGEVLKRLVQTLTLPSSLEEQYHTLHFLKTNPNMIDDYIKHRQQQQQVPLPCNAPRLSLSNIAMNSVLVNMNANSANLQNNVTQVSGSNTATNPLRRQQQEWLENLNQTQISGLNTAMNALQVNAVLQNNPALLSVSNTTMNPPQGNIPGNPASETIPKPNRRSLQQLLQNLRLPSSPQQQDCILNILKTNPALLANFIKQRQKQLHEQRPRCYYNLHQLKLKRMNK